MDILPLRLEMSWSDRGLKILTVLSLPNYVR
jgi:hypothetical protein